MSSTRNDLNKKVIEFEKKWEEEGWKSLDYEVFEMLARMFPAPCQELYPLLIDEETGETKLYLVRRPNDDKRYSNMWHNPGTAHRSTDSIILGSVQNKQAFETVPTQILKNETNKPTWNLTGREKALHRVLTSNEIGVSGEEALKVLQEGIVNAGDFELEWTHRGPELGVLNIWLVEPGLAEKLGENSPTEVGWHNVLDLKTMAEQEGFLEHQVNRTAKALDYVRENINPKCPRIPIFTP